jgi:hypothetical protein
VTDALADLDRRHLWHPVTQHQAWNAEEPLIITDAGLEAIGVEPDPAPQAATRGEETDEAPAAPAEASSQPAPATTPRERKTRGGTKQALVIEMLRRPEGASIAEIVKATGWLSHTARGVLAGSLKKKLGLAIDSETDAVRGRIYKVGA